MRVSRVQAEENRQAVINVASRLFREHGFDGIGLKDLMKAAGLTQGAFYKQFASKEDLTVQASKRALESASGRWTSATATNPEDPLGEVIGFYLSDGHRKERTDGCPIVALGSDVARHGTEVKASFEAGIRTHLDVIERLISQTQDEEFTSKAMAILSMMVGALTLARAINDPVLAQAFLDSASMQIRKIADARMNGIAPGKG
ncbi:TetR family transcriptional regulator (plasmid) [Azospirillum humicireducens]|uniref:TetR family transcriptional regulator n=1 Tax=Azospirillum humicireducens TaxID=1226968 RepID=A0A2R4VTJ2_9PROT|nr:TetR/AcrR family transcriptional regulator [Azospirillum humicireducens]AWB07747.1 TetR family transcriptional regulator [Azospirillum humicireducens]